MSFSTLGCGFFGAGMRQDVFHSAGTFPSWRLRLKICCRGTASSTAHALRSLGQTPSGPAAFLGRSLLSSPVTCSAVMLGGRGGSVWSPGGRVQLWRMAEGWKLEGVGPHWLSTVYCMPQVTVSTNDYNLNTRDDTADMLYVKHSVLVSAERLILDVSSDVPWKLYHWLHSL